MQTKISFDQFAFNLGNLAKQTRAASLPLHQAYVKATPEQQADLRQRWILNHLNGQKLNGGEILPKTRTERSADETRAFDKARADFKYHVQRPEPASKAPAKRERISKDLRELAQALIDAAGDKATALKVLRAI